MTSADAYARHDRERRRHLRRNYLAHSIEGGLFIGGMAFVAPNTVMPRLAELLEAPDWVVGLMPAMMWIGLGLPPLFVAHHIERLPRYKPLLMVTTVFQRLPFLFAALALMFLAGPRPVLALGAVVLAPLVSGLFGGITFTAWMELVARTLPPERRASVLAWRNVISSVMGLFAGGIIAAVLNRYPGTLGFGVLHLVTFFMLVASYAAFSLIRETERPPQNQGPPQSLAANLRSLPGLLRAQPVLGRFIVARGLTMGQFLMIPYLAIHTLRVTGRPDSFLGLLVSVQMGGAIVGNAAAGWLGDRYGGKRVLLAGNVLLLAVCAGGALAGTPLQFAVVYALVGAGFFASRVGIMTLSIEVSPREKRATALGLMTFINVIAMAGASLLSGVAWGWGKGFGPGALLAGLCLAAACAVLLTFRDPRRRTVPARTAGA